MNGFANDVATRVAEYEEALKQDMAEHKSGGQSLSDVRRKTDRVLYLHSTAARLVEDHAGTKLHRGYALIKGSVDRWFGFLADWFVEMVKNEASEFDSREERVVFLREQLTDLEVEGYGGSDVGKRLIARIAAILKSSERQREPASQDEYARGASDLQLGDNELMWTGTSTEFGLVFKCIYEKFILKDKKEGGVSEIEFFRIIASHFRVRKYERVQNLNSESARTIAANGKNMNRKDDICNAIDEVIAGWDGG